MSLDDSANWKHAERIERGEDLMAPTSPREAAVFSLMSMLQDENHTEAFTRRQVDRLIANAGVVVERLSAVKVAPDRVQLRQDRVAETDAVTWWLEHTAHLKREYEDSCRILDRVTAAAHRDRFDPDAREMDREDDRLREQRQSEAASDQAPRVAS